MAQQSNSARQGRARKERARQEASRQGQEGQEAPSKDGGALLPLLDTKDTKGPKQGKDKGPKAKDSKAPKEGKESKKKVKGTKDKAPKEKPTPCWKMYAKVKVGKKGLDLPVGMVLAKDQEAAEAAFKKHFGTVADSRVAEEDKYMRKVLGHLEYEVGEVCELE
jgi:hypothetical protein